MRCLEDQLGFAAFAIEGAQEQVKALDLVQWGVKLGMRHPQFAIGLMSDETAKAVYERCSDLGARASSLVFLGPDHYPFNPKQALETLKPQLMRAMLMAPECCRVVGPLFRPLGDPKTGLAGEVDLPLMVEFLEMLAEEIVQYATMEFGLEILNNHESRGPNKLAAARSILEKVKGGERFLFLPDTCHIGMCEDKPQQAWIESVAQAALVHLSPFDRQHLAAGTAVSQFMVQTAFASGRPVVMELFGKNTPDGFFDLLHIHEKGDDDCEVLYLQGKRYIEQLLSC